MPKDNKDESIKVRMTPEQKRLCDRAASLDERSISEWSRRALVRQAKEELKAAGEDVGDDKGKKR